MIQEIQGGFHNKDGAKVGEIVELPEEHALRYIHFGIADFVDPAPSPEENKIRHDHAREVAVAFAARMAAAAADSYS
jgi:hypothetical protein